MRSWRAFSSEKPLRCTYPCTPQDEQKRKTLLGNPKARPIRPALEMLAAGGIQFHTQAVLCKGLNDGAVFRETMAYLYGMYPAVMTLAAVPCGLTAHRQALPQLEPTDRESARETIRDVEAFQQRALAEKGTRFVFASDEMYIKAALQPPAYETYEEFPQIENGVGLVRKFEWEVCEALEEYREAKPRYKSVSVATGTDAYPYIRRIFEKIGEIYSVEAAVYAVENLFFGNSVTVAGLLTGRDVCDALKGKPLGDVLLLPESMMRENEELFLDGMTLEQMKKELGAEILRVPVDGYALVEALTQQPKDVLIK